MPHRADHPALPPHHMMMRGLPPHLVGAQPPPPPPHPYGPMHPADAAAVAAAAAHHRARLYSAQPSLNPQHRSILRNTNREQRPGPPPVTMNMAPASQKRPAPSNSIDDESPEEAAASALLLSATGGGIFTIATTPKQADSEPPSVTSIKSSSSEDEEPDQSSQPRVKRKKHLDVLRRNNCNLPCATTTGANAPERTKDNNKDLAHPPCHVSPVSGSSVGGNSHASTEETTSTTVPSASRTSSYDLKESQARSTPDVFRKRDVSTSTDGIIGSKSDVMVTVPSSDPTPSLQQQHFPTVLHNLLSNSEFAGTVVEWLPHGQAWRIMRWDALRREVLPVHFPNLSRDKGSSSKEGSIDDFLWHLRAWGFDEIKEGPDVGGYCHILFLRGVPKLCQQMRFTEEPNADEESPKTGNSASPAPKDDTTGPHESPQQSSDASTNRTILQVPSLASRSVDTIEKQQGIAQKQGMTHARIPSSLKENRPSFSSSSFETSLSSPSDTGGWRQQQMEPRPNYHVDHRSYTHRHFSPPESAHHHVLMHPHHQQSLPPSPAANRPWFPFGGQENPVHEQHPLQPVQGVRSTRGGSGGGAARGAKPLGRTMENHHSPAVSPTGSQRSSEMSITSKRSFPVSQRGKARGARAHQAIQTKKQSGPTLPTQEHKKDVVLTISRETKRNSPSLSH